LEFDGSPRPRSTRVHWLEVEQRLSADASVRQPAAPEKVAKLSRIEKFSRGRPDFTALTAAPWRGPELIRDPAGRSGISLRQHPARTATRFGSAPTSGFVPAVGRRTSAAAGFLTQTLVNDLPSKLSSVQVKYLTSATSSGRTQCTRLSTRGRAEAAGARWRNVERHFVCCSNRRRRVFCAMSQARTGSFWVPTIRSRLVIPSQRGSSDKPLTAAERRAILGETAARIFHIDCSCIDDC
jgi:hypothetical protein